MEKCFMRRYLVEYGYVRALQRANFEFERARSNVAFLINAHANDDNADFLESDFFKRIENLAVEKREQQKEFCLGVAVITTGDDRIRDYQYSNDLTMLIVK